MIDGGVGIAAIVSVGTKFVERSTFTARHDASCDKEADKTLKLRERFDRIPQEDVDLFEFQEYTVLHSRSMENIRYYRKVQEEYKQKDWFKAPFQKLRSRGRVRQAKRSLQFSYAREEDHLHDLEIYSRANSSCGSSLYSRPNSYSGLDLGRFSRPYRMDSFSIRAVGGSPPQESLEDIHSDEWKAQTVDNISAWLSSGEMGTDSVKAYKIQCSSCGATLSRRWGEGPSGEIEIELCNGCGLSQSSMDSRPLAVPSLSTSSANVDIDEDVWEGWDYKDKLVIIKAMEEAERFVDISAAGYLDAEEDSTKPIAMDSEGQKPNGRERGRT